MDIDDDEFEEEEAEDSSEGYAPPSTEPSWAKKLEAKVKSLFRMLAKGSTRPTLLRRRFAGATRGS